MPDPGIIAVVRRRHFNQERDAMNFHNYLIYKNNKYWHESCIETGRSTTARKEKPWKNWLQRQQSLSWVSRWARVLPIPAMPRLALRPAPWSAAAGAGAAAGYEIGKRIK